AEPDEKVEEVLLRLFAAALHETHVVQHHQLTQRLIGIADVHHRNAKRTLVLPQDLIFKFGEGIQIGAANLPWECRRCEGAAGPGRAESNRKKSLVSRDSGEKPVDGARVV